jgi:hypothetical protein
MSLAGLSPGAVLRLAREARDGDHPAGPLLVIGPLSAQLAKSLADGGDASFVRTGGDASSAGAFVCVLGGAPTPEQEAQLRLAARAGVPTIGVQAGDPEARVPYVLPGDVVVCPPGQGFPVAEIAAAIVRGLGREAAPLAARLPVLRTPAHRVLAARAAGAAAGLAAVPWGTDEHMPVLVLLQARLLRDLAITSGRPAPATQQEIGTSVGPELGSAVALGIAARSFVRRLPVRNRLIDAAVAGGATLALATAAARLRAAS